MAAANANIKIYNITETAVFSMISHEYSASGKYDLLKRDTMKLKPLLAKCMNMVMHIEPVFQNTQPITHPITNAGIA